MSRECRRFEPLDTIAALLRFVAAERSRLQKRM
jgi:hypothetical protein